MRWLGFNTKSPAIGLEVTDEALVIAMVRPMPTRVVGLGRHALDPGVVVGGDPRQPERLAAAFKTLLAPLHMVRRPALSVAMPPAPAATAEVSSVPVANPVTDSVEALGTVTASTRQVATMKAAFGSHASAVVVDSAPVAVARFLRVAGTQPDQFYARGIDAASSWTLCVTPDALEVESAPMRGSTPRVEVGSDLGRLAAPRWGSLVVDRIVHEQHREPGAWTVAVGAGLCALGLHPVIDFAGTDVTKTGQSDTWMPWTVERVT